MVFYGWKVCESTIHSVPKAGGLNWSSGEMLGCQGRNGFASKVGASRQLVNCSSCMALCRLPEEGVAQAQVKGVSSGLKMQIKTTKDCKISQHWVKKGFMTNLTGVVVGW